MLRATNLLISIPFSGSGRIPVAMTSHTQSRAVTHNPAQSHAVVRGGKTPDHKHFINHKHFNDHTHLGLREDGPRGMPSFWLQAKWVALSTAFWTILSRKKKIFYVFFLHAGLSSNLCHNHSNVALVPVPSPLGSPFPCWPKPKCIRDFP